MGVQTTETGNLQDYCSSNPNIGLGSRIVLETFASAAKLEQKPVVGMGILRGTGHPYICTKHYQINRTKQLDMTTASWQKATSSSFPQHKHTGADRGGGMDTFLLTPSCPCQVKIVRYREWFAGRGTSVVFAMKKALQWTNPMWMKTQWCVVS